MLKHTIYILAAALFLATGCRPRQLAVLPAQLLSDTGRNASCPFLAYTPEEDLVLSWVECPPGQEEGMLYYARFDREAQAFGKPRAIPVTQGVLPHAENMPKLVFRPGGQVIAMYGVAQHDARNKYAGRVCYTQSFDDGRTWSPPRPLVQDTASYDQRYFDMARLPNGEAAAIWLDNRRQTDAEGSTLYYAVTSGRNGFTQERPIAQTVCQCCRTDLYVDDKGGIHAAFRDIIQDSIRDMVHLLSEDGGRSFSPPVRISADNWVVRGCPHTGPTMAMNRYGLHFAWFTMGNGSGVFYCRSDDNGKTYTKREAVSTQPMAKHPQLAVLDNGDLLLVWDEPVKAGAGFNSRICLAHKSGGGRTLRSLALTPDTQYASYPVIGRLKKGGGAVVVYKQRAAGDREQVWMRVIKNE